MKKKINLAILALAPTFVFSTISMTSIELAQAKTNNIIDYSNIDIGTNKSGNSYFYRTTWSSEGELYNYSLVDQATSQSIFHSEPIIEGERPENINDVDAPAWQAWIDGSQEIVDTWDSVLARDTIKTVRNESHYFNFIKNPNRENKIDIVATPAAGANVEDIIVIPTTFDNVEDSAIYFNKNLIFVATQGSNKILVNYKFAIETITVDVNGSSGNQALKRILTLEEKSRMNVTNIFGSSFMSNKVFALSPVEKTFDSADRSEVILWPMGATTSEFLDQRQSFLFKISIDANGNLSRSGLNPDIEMTGNDDQIVSITPLQIIDDAGNEEQTKFFATTRSTNPQQPINIVEFGLGTPKTSTILPIVQTSTDISNYQWAELEKIVPYAMVRKNQVGNNDIYSLFWISQNNAERTALAAETTPEALIRVEVTRSRTGQEFQPINASNVNAIEFTNRGVLDYHMNDFNHGQSVPRIQQIHYAIDDGLGDSNIAVRFNQATYVGQSRTNNFLLGAIPAYTSLSINAFDEPTVLSTFARTSQENEDSRHHLRASVITTLGGADVNMMATIVNNSFTSTYMSPIQQPLDTYGTAEDIDEKHLPVPYIATQTRAMNNFLRNQFNTSQITDQVYLPQEQSNEFVGYTRQITPAQGDEPEKLDLIPYNLPVKVADLNYVSNTLNGVTTYFPEDSMLWYVRYWLKDINHSVYFGEFDGDVPLYGFVEVPQFYKDGEIILGTDVNVKETYANANEVQFSIIVPRYFFEGIYTTGSPLKLSYTFKDNPGKATINSSTNPVLKVNDNSLSGAASTAANAINILGETRAIPINQDFVKLDNQADLENTLFVINEDYFNNSFLNATATANDFLGTLKVDFEFMDISGNIYHQTVELTGYTSTWIYLPAVGGSLFAISLAVLIIVLVIRKKNKEKAAKSQRYGFALAKKMEAKNTDFEINSRTNTVELKGDNQVVSAIVNPMAKKPGGPPPRPMSDKPSGPPPRPMSGKPGGPPPRPMSGKPGGPPPRPMNK